MDILQFHKQRVLRNRGTQPKKLEYSSHLIQRIILFILWRNAEQERHPDVKCFAELVFTVASLPQRFIKPLFALGGCELQSLLAISDA